MSAIRFFLKPSFDKNNEQLIMLTYQDKGERFRYSAVHKINAKFWDSTKQRVKGTHTLGTEINIDLDSLKNRIHKIILDARNSGKIPTAQFIKELLDQMTANSHKVELEEFIRQFIINSNSTPGTKKIYNNTLNHLLKYGKLVNQNITFDKISLVFYEEFISYLFNDKELNGNSVGKIIKTLKTFLNNAAEKGLIDKKAFSKFKVITQTPDIIALTKDELNALFSFDLKEKSSLDKVRDVFCFSCFTSLRFSDVRALKREQIKGNNIRLTTQKTNQNISIPLVPQSLLILDKYKEDNFPLPVRSNVKTNKYIKEVCKLVGIDSPTAVVKYKGNVKQYITAPKHDLIAFHTARRTFVTLALENGMRPEVLMKITGHTTIREFYRYAIITQEVTKNDLQKVFSEM